jgi:hypothetical protein
VRLHFDVTEARETPGGYAVIARTFRDELPHRIFDEIPFFGLGRIGLTLQLDLSIPLATVPPAVCTPGASFFAEIEDSAPVHPVTSEPQMPAARRKQ